MRMVAIWMPIRHRPWWEMTKTFPLKAAVAARVRVLERREWFARLKPLKDDMGRARCTELLHVCCKGAAHTEAVRTPMKIMHFREQHMMLHSVRLRVLWG